MCCCIGEDVWLRFADFDSPTSFSSPFMKGRRYMLFMDRHIILEKGVQYLDKPLGGFDFLGGLQMAEDSVIVVHFY